MARKKTETTDQKLDRLLGAFEKLTEVLTKNTTQPKVEDESQPKRRGRPPKSTEKPKERSNINPLNGKPFIDFGTLPESKRERKDIIIDKKLWGKNKPEPRGKRKSNRIEINCTSCNKPCSVLPEETSKESKYKCNTCITKGNN